MNKIKYKQPTYFKKIRRIVQYMNVDKVENEKDIRQIIIDKTEEVKKRYGTFTLAKRARIKADPTDFDNQMR